MLHVVGRFTSTTSLVCWIRCEGSVSFADHMSETIRRYKSALLWLAGIFEKHQMGYENNDKNNEKDKGASGEMVA